MNPLELIKQSIDPIVLLEHYRFDRIRDLHHEIRACCAIHGGDNPNAFVWNKKRGLWFCFTGDCGGGDVFDLIMKIEHCNFVESVNKASRLFNVNIEGMSIHDVEVRYQREQVSWLQKMEARIKKETNETINLDYSVISITYPRFDKETIDKFNAKLCERITINENTFTNKLVIPILDGEQTRCVALRSLDDGIPKWIYQPKQTKLSEMLYNYDNAIRCSGNEIVLVEGIFDVWAYYEAGIDNVVAIFGSHISKPQYEILMKLNCELILSFDNDDAGRKATKKAIELFNKKAEIKLIDLPDGSDPDDITRKELRTAYERRKRC